MLYLQSSLLIRFPLASSLFNKYQFKALLYIFCTRGTFVFLISCFFISEINMVIDDRNGDCPWLALMDMMKTSSDIRPLRVLWRTQLNPPRFLHSNDRWPDIQENWYNYLD